MKSILRPVTTGAATLFVLASAASLAVDPIRALRGEPGPIRALRGEPGVERTVSLADLCDATGCSIAYKTGDGGPPSRILPAR